MNNLLRTRNLFIDTSVFYSLKFQWHSEVIDRLVESVASGKIHLYTTPVTTQEIEANMGKMVDEASSALNAFRKNATILSNITDPPFGSIFVRLNKSEVKSTLHEQFERFLEAAKVNVVPIDNVSISHIFSKYFSNEAPFGKEEKKHEFPDAFVLAALENWCEEKNEMMYIISGDSDMVATCETSTQLFSLPSIEALFDLVSKHDEELSPFVIDLLDKHIGEIEDKIQKEFEQLGFWLEDQDGDVNAVSILALDILDKYLVWVKDQSAKFVLSTTLTISADVTYDDLDTAIYDSEDKVLIPLHTINEVIETELDLKIEVEIGFDSNQPEYFEIVDLNIDGNKDIGITVRGYAYYL